MSAIAVLSEAKKSGLPLTHIPPLAICFEQEDDANDVVVRVEVNPLFQAAMEVLGLSIIDDRTFSLNRDNSRQLNGFLETVFERLLYTESQVTSNNGRMPLRDAYKGKSNRSDVLMLLDPDSKDLGAGYPGFLTDHPEGHPWGNVAISLSKNRERIIARVITDKFEVNGYDLNQLKVKTTKKPLTLPLIEAINLRAELRRLGYTITGTDLDATEKDLATTVHAQVAKDSFGEIEIRIGKDAPGATGFTARSRQVCRMEILPLDEAGNKLGNFRKSGSNVTMTEGVKDLLRMSLTGPVERDGLSEALSAAVSAQNTTGRGTLVLGGTSTDRLQVAARSLVEGIRAKSGAYHALALLPNSSVSYFMETFRKLNAETSLIASNSGDTLRNLENPDSLTLITIASKGEGREGTPARWDMLVIEESPTNPWKSNGGADLNELRKKASKGLYLTSLKPEEQLEDIAGKLTLIRGEKEKDINLPTRFPNLNRDTTKQALKATLGPAVINLDA